MAKLKVYSITAFVHDPITPELLGDRPHIRQANATVAAPTKKAAAEAFGVTMYELNRSGGETGNDGDIAVAMTEPGTVFYRSMNVGNRQSFRADGTPAVPTEHEPKKRPYFTAGELAEILDEIPSDTPIFVPGLEEGVNYATSLTRTNVELFANAKNYEGQHAEEPAPMFRHRDPRAFADHGYTLTGKHIQEAGQ